MAGRPGSDAPHLPTPAPIDAYGNGGFRFAGMSHRGSLLCLPDDVLGTIQLETQVLADVVVQAGRSRRPVLRCGHA